MNHVLTLQQGAFLAALTAVIPPGKIGWSSDDHYELLTKIIESLKDNSGNAPSISTKLSNILKLIYKPTEDVERAVLHQAMEDDGYSLDDEAEKVFILMFSAPQFADFLAKTIRPKTNDKFIIKDKKRGAKKDTFTTLISTAEATPVAEVPTGDTAEVVEETETPTPEPTPATEAKARATRK